MRGAGMRSLFDSLPAHSAKALVLSAALLAGGCSTLAGSPPPATYDLSAPRDVEARGNSRAQIMVAEPTALQAINSDRILVHSANSQISYLPGAQWADRLPLLVQARLIQTFENAHRIGTVGRPDDKFTPDALLVTELRDFQIDTGASPIAVVTVAARVVSQKSGRIVAANLFSARVPAAGLSGQQASGTLDQALRKVLVEIVAWTTSKASLAS
ncbi:ABC-type transport auxiliary lipoprotein family protein [Labrys sp. KB_33_2]|uniref:ABC-type transport auxiliary lipoprotein family protein n=1 Tax=unclassified Labrys (in: a-proteobacteria) TaxID=2688601 RepID=UPI003EBDC7F3